MLEFTHRNLAKDASEFRDVVQNNKLFGKIATYAQTYTDSAKDCDPCSHFRVADAYSMPFERSSINLELSTSACSSVGSCVVHSACPVSVD